MDKAALKQTAKKIWHFLWKDDSFASLLVNVILAFLLIRYLVYPALGAVLGTSFPIVAVVSSSMEHHESFDLWWGDYGAWYEQHNITKSQFKEFPMKNGFNKGDIIILRKGKNVEIGDIIVFMSHAENPRPDPIIHRVIAINSFQTKGDNNPRQINDCNDGCLDETNIRESQVMGKGVLRIPYLGWVKIVFVNIIGQPYCSATNNAWPCR